MEAQKSLSECDWVQLSFEREPLLEKPERASVVMVLLKAKLEKLVVEWERQRAGSEPLLVPQVPLSVQGLARLWVEGEPLLERLGRMLE